MKKSSLLAMTQAILAAVLFGASAPLSKVLLQEAEPIPLAGLLYLGSGIGAALLLAFQRLTSRTHAREAPMTRADMPWMLGAILAGGVGGPLLLLSGLKITPASTASLLLNFEGVATALIAAWVFKETIGRQITWSIVLITFASILLTWTSGSWGVSLGALAVVGACILWGFDNNFTRQISAKNPLSIVAIKGFAAGSFSILLAFVLGKELPAAGTLVTALAIGIVCYGVGIRLFILALRGLGAARTGALYGIAPFIGTALALMFLVEKPQPLFWAALPGMLLGAGLMLSENHQHAHTHQPLEHSHAHDHADEHHEHAKGDHETGVRHAHTHFHAELSHVHAHTPDLHHRHLHEEGKGTH